MTLMKSFVAGILLISSLAQANVITLNRGSRGEVQNYGPVPDNGNQGQYPGQGGSDLPYPDDSQNDRWDGQRGDRQGDYRDDRRRSRTEEIYVGRYLRNESIDLMRELSHLRGATVRSVSVYIQRSRDVHASVELLVNGRSEDSRRADIGRAVTLTPRSIVEIGRGTRSLDLHVRGEMLIDRIVVQLASESHRPPPYQDGREIAVRLNLPSYLPPASHLDVTPYIEVGRYRGYRIVGVEITAASASLHNASLDVQMNGFTEGRIVLGRRQTTQVVRSRQNLVLGSSFGSLVLAPRGDSNIMEIRLILSRH